MVHRILEVLLHTSLSSAKDTGPGSEEKWYAALARKPNGSWNRVAEPMMVLLAESWYIVCSERASSIHHNADPATTKLIPRINVSVHQLFGAVGDFCQEFICSANFSLFFLAPEILLQKCEQ